MPKRKSKKENQDNSVLFKRIAAFVILAYGILLILATHTSITGAVIGTQHATPTTFFFGFILFILGLVLYPRH